MTKNLKKPDIDRLIASPNLNGSIIELDNYICSLCEWGDDIPVLSYPQMVFYFNQELEREVNNGGFDLYFSNSSGAYATDTIEALQLIRAEKTSKILQSAIKTFPNSIVPIDRDQRRETIEKISLQEKGKWEELTEQFFKYEDDLNKLNMAFVKKNRKYF